jgi:GTP-binding protein
MVDGVLLLIDAQEGPMPQTRFVTKKALALGLKPILVVNKVDKPGANCDKVINAAFDLFDKLGANDEQLDFPVVYASGINGWSSHEEGAAGEQWGPDMSALFETILEHVPVHEGDPQAPLQLQISALDYSTFVGRIGVGRINAGTLRAGMDVLVMEGSDGATLKGRINQVHTFQGLDRVQTEVAGPGDIVLINGIADLGIGVTVTDPNDPQPLPMLKIDEPTLTMNFCVNTSPLAGREGKYVTSRQIWDRLQKELQSNVALRVRETDEDGIFEVSGRGELHLTILLENMRREGYELAVSKPRVVYKDIDGERCEPIELVTCDIEENHQGGVMQALGERKGDLVNMEPDGRGRVRLEYRIPARGLIGFSNEFLNLTRGSGLISNIFDSYEAHKGDIGGRKNGVLISMDDGEIFTYALGKLDDRGRMFVKAGDPVYEGMIVGIHNRDNDLVVNATRTKQLTNFRVSGKEDAIKVTPPIDLSLEYGVEFIEDDELVEITPKSIRLRKRHLKEHERKRASREA